MRFHRERNMPEKINDKCIVGNTNSTLKFSGDLPLVSIVSVVYNDKDKIEQTILGVLNQNYKNFEYIIVDGGSKDGTIDIIKKYEDKISCWVSEKDNGIYDAMNKGIDLANGEWINFMNAGDTFCSNDVLECIFANKNISSDLIYGGAIFRDSGGVLIPKPASNKLDDLWKKSQFGHESLFTRSVILRENKFDLHYRVAADYDFIMKCYYHNNYKFESLNLDVLLFIAPFFSSEHWVRSSLETWRIARKYRGGIEVNVFYVSNFIIRLFVIFIKKILPTKVYTKFKKMVSNYNHY